ncbi:MAG: DUF1003 domain-containing protein [Verrucomicrobiota bacterium]
MAMNLGQDNSGLARVVDRNITALLERRKAEERELSWPEKLAAAITRFAGSMKFVLIHLVIYGLWVLINLGWLPILPKFDPTFVVLAMEASVEAIFLSTFIMITQNRMMALSDRRADLNLQVSLLAEHEITRLIQMVREISKQVGLPQENDRELDELSQDVPPEQVLESLEEHEKKIFPES